MWWKTTEGNDLYYQVAGSGHPLLLIHGLGGSSQDWGLQLPTLRKNFQVVTIDLRGHGCSSKPPSGYTIPGFAADAASLLKSLSLPATHVMGISLGGMIAFQLALDFPERVAKLVIVNSTPELPRSSWRQHWEFGQRFFLTRLFGMKWTARVLARRLFPKEEQKPLRRGFEKRWAKNDPRIYTETLRGMMGWSVREQLPDLTAPTLVVAGDRDFIPLEFKRSYTSRIPRADLVVIRDSGHATPADQPETFNRIVLDFLARLDSPGKNGEKNLSRTGTPLG